MVHVRMAEQDSSRASPINCLREQVLGLARGVQRPSRVEYQPLSACFQFDAAAANGVRAAMYR